MADFCAQCWPRVWGDPKEIGQAEGFNDMMGVCGSDEMFRDVCEGCGVSYFDSRGRCLGPCMEHHEMAPAPPDDTKAERAGSPQGGR